MSGLHIYPFSPEEWAALNADCAALMEGAERSGQMAREALDRLEALDRPDVVEARRGAR